MVIYGGGGLSLSLSKSLGYYCNAGNRHQMQALLLLIPICPSLFTCGDTPTTDGPANEINKLSTRPLLALPHG